MLRTAKAAFLLNFARLVQWPGSAFEGPKAPIVVGFLGADAFEAARSAGIEKKRVSEYPVEIQRVSGASEATQSQAKSNETIEHALQVFRDVTDEATRRAEAINTMVATLSERSEHLEQEIDRFKTG